VPKRIRLMPGQSHLNNPIHGKINGEEVIK
jgi:hypothetical protein